MPLTLDTSPAVERLQIERWRQMSDSDTAAVLAGLTQVVYDLALAGVRHRHPGASPREQFLRLALLNPGPDRARRPYPRGACGDGAVRSLAIAYSSHRSSTGSASRIARCAKAVKQSDVTAVSRED